MLGIKNFGLGIREDQALILALSFDRCVTFSKFFNPFMAELPIKMGILVLSTSCGCCHQEDQKQ